jgi:hypothetical protein
MRLTKKTSEKRSIKQNEKEIKRTHIHRGREWEEKETRVEES